MGRPADGAVLDVEGRKVSPNVHREIGLEQLLLLLPVYLSDEVNAGCVRLKLDGLDYLALLQLVREADAHPVSRGLDYFVGGGLIHS